MLPQPLPPVTPPGNSIKIRLSIFVIGLVYGVGAYGMHKMDPTSCFPFIVPAAIAILGSLSDEHNAHNVLFCYNVIIMIFTWFTSTLLLVAVVCNMYFEFDEFLTSRKCYMAMLAYVSVACFCIWARKIINIAREATKPINVEEQ